MKIIFCLILITAAIFLHAQVIENAFTPNLLTPSFLNPNNLSINHSVKFSGGYSSNSQSYYESVYTNHITYRFNPRLNLKVDLNFVNFGTATHTGGIEFEGNNDNASRVLPNFQLNWKPTENTNITIEYRNYYNPLEYYHRW
jgi:hypothetical protein